MITLRSRPNVYLEHLEHTILHCVKGQKAQTSFRLSYRIPLLQLFSPLSNRLILHKRSQRRLYNVMLSALRRANMLGLGISPAYCMSHDNSWPIALKFMSIGASKIANPGQVVMTLDHDVQNESESNLKKYKQIEEFAKKHGVDFYERYRGIGHQIMVESGYAWPGSLVVASDSHSNMYGGVGCLGTPIVRTDTASIWATGRTWWQVPQIVQVRFTGVLPLGVTGKEYVYLSPFFYLSQLFVFPDSVVSILDICHNTQYLSLKQALLTAKFYKCNRRPMQLIRQGRSIKSCYRIHRIRRNHEKPPSGCSTDYRQYVLFSVKNLPLLIQF